MTITGLMFAPFWLRVILVNPKKAIKRIFHVFPCMPSQVPTRRRLGGLNKIIRDIPTIEVLSDVHGKINYATPANGLARLLHFRKRTAEQV